MAIKHRWICIYFSWSESPSVKTQGHGEMNIAKPTSNPYEQIMYVNKFDTFSSSNLQNKSMFACCVGTDMSDVSN